MFYIAAPICAYLIWGYTDWSQFHIGNTVLNVSIAITMFEIFEHFIGK